MKIKITSYHKQQETSELHVSTSDFSNEVKKRIPWILFATAAGIVMVLIGQTYEEVLARNIHLVFFIPMIVYISDSIGTETLALFVRELSSKQFSVKKILLKEIFVGLSLGLTSGILMGLFSYVWFQDLSLALTVTLAMIINGLVAVLTGMFFPIVFAKLGIDPAIGTDEMTTAVSDNISILIYMLVATLVLFGAN